MADTDFPIIQKLGGRDAVVERLRAAGHKSVTRDAARMWLSRGRLPGWAYQTLMQFAEADRVPYSADDFLVPSADGTVNRTTPERPAQFVQSRMGEVA